jgi:hypothetical protein
MAGGEGSRGPELSGGSVKWGKIRDFKAPEEKQSHGKRNTLLFALAALTAVIMFARFLAS